MWISVFLCPAVDLQPVPGVIWISLTVFTRFQLPGSPEQDNELKLMNGGMMDAKWSGSGILLGFLPSEVLWTLPARKKWNAKMIMATFRQQILLVNSDFWVKSHFWGVTNLFRPKIYFKATSRDWPVYPMCMHTRMPLSATAIMGP